MSLRFVFKLITIPICLFTILVAVNMIRFNYPYDEALERTIFFYSQTKWCKNYSETKFSEIELGMTKENVIKILPDPLWKSCSGKGCTWAYATGISVNVDFDRRYIYFDKNGFVNDMQRDYFAD